MDWLQTWDPPTVEMNRRIKEFVHTASDQFPEREIAEGDRVFVGYIGDGDRNPRGRLYLSGAVIAASPRSLGVGRSDRGWLNQREAEKVLGPGDTWRAAGHVVCEPSGASKAVFEREVPSDLLRKITFLVKDRGGWDYTYLKLTSDGTLAQQTLRRVRRLHPTSAEAIADIVNRRRRRTNDCSPSARVTG